MQFFAEQFIEPDLPLLSDKDEQNLNKEVLPEQVPILPLKNTVLFPGVIIPITVARDKSIQLVKEAYNKEKRLIGVVAQKNPGTEQVSPDDLYQIGTIAHIMRMIKMPDGSITIVIQGRNRFKIDSFASTEPYLIANITKAEEFYPSAAQTKALMLNLRSEAKRIIELSPNIPSEANIALHNISSLGFLVHFIASNLTIEVAEKQKILETKMLQEKATLVLEHLNREFQVLELSEEIHTKVKTDMDRQQREYILRQQIKTIQDELGDEGFDAEIEELRRRAEKKNWPEAAMDVFEKELNKLYRSNTNSPDYSMIMNYIEWLLDLPWHSYSDQSFDLKRASEILEEDHYGLEKVKERILEYLAVLKLRGNKKAPILCFYGPPGVGKTSLGKSIAKALGREFIRMSLGGVRDEAEIRGHRRTYLGSMPGRILQNLKKVKTGNPVFMLDEIDKLANDFRGDPSSALLEVLDPQQNHTFSDHFIEVDYDLSPIFFIATANNIYNIQPALLDRMELIEINGYTLEEKVQIAKRHLLTEIRKDHGIKAPQLKVHDKALAEIIEGYTRESGVRKLTQQIGAICRHTAKKIVVDEVKSVQVNAGGLVEFLGIKKFENSLYEDSLLPGVVTGLAWTPVGGDILFIESVLSRGTGKMSLTGQLGDVMKESASAAYTYLKANAQSLNIPEKAFTHWDIHIHIPAGAIPKDGPSAGITMLTAMASAFTQHKAKSKIAMTGEITLRGTVLPVGGIKEKVLAAARAGITKIIMCKENEKDVLEIKEAAIKDIKFIFVDRVEEVLQHALEKKPVPNALDLEAARANPAENKPVTGI